MDVTCNSVQILRTPGHILRKGRDSTTRDDEDVVVRPPRDNGPVLIWVIVSPPTTGNSGSQDIITKRKSISLSVGRNAPKFDASVHRNLADDGDSTAIFRKVMGRELYKSISSDIHFCCQVDFTSNSVGTKAPNFVHLGIPDVSA